MPTKRGIPFYEKGTYDLENNVLRGQKNIDLNWFVTSKSL